MFQYLFSSLLPSNRRLLILMGLLSSFVQALAGERLVVHPEDAEMAWWRDSQETLDARMEWWNAARFGMFIHWGAYSHLEGFWQGESKHNYSEQIMKHSRIPIPVYESEVVAPFNPVHFDAEAWVEICVEAGMKYMVLTAKHHDGFAMWDSETTDYDIMDATSFGRDPIAELRDACRARGIKLGLYYSQALDWHHPQGTGNALDYDYPWHRDWWREDVPHREAVKTYVDEKAIPQVLELIEKYDVDLLWFDTPIHLPPRENLRILRAAREAKPNVIVSSRIYFHRIIGDYLTTTDLPINFAPTKGYWEAVPSVNHSYGYHRGDTDFFDSAHFIRLLAKAAARGGNTLLNVGPKGDGTIDPTSSGILRGVGDWLKVNGDSIYGTSRTPIPVHAWGRTTVKGNHLYLHVLNPPRKGPLLLHGVAVPVKRALLLADETELSVKQSENGILMISLPPELPDPVNTVIALECSEPITTNSESRLLVDEPDFLHAFDAQLTGGVRYGKGNDRFNFVHKWEDAEATVRWPVRVREPMTLDLSLHYSADQGSLGNSLAVEVDGKRFVHTVQARSPQEMEDPLRLGTVTLQPGEHVITVRAVEMPGKELVRLQGLRLIPVTR